MPSERLSMRHVRDVLRLKFAGVAVREIARRVGAAPSTVRETLKRATAAGLRWPLPEALTDVALETQLFANSGNKQGFRRQVAPDWAGVHRELRRNKHVTLMVLWEEYIAREAEGYRYSRYCDLYREWEGRLSVTMRQTHAAGDKLFVDYAGDTVSVIVDRLTGEVRDAQIFVAVLGASGFTFAHASWTQTLPDFVDSHVRAFGAIGGVPQLLVPDNTKTAVIKACLYEPQLNRSYADMARHYGCAVLPARPRKPRDRAKVEQAVLVVERWLLGRLRHRTFFSLAEVNAAIGDLLARLNEERPIRRLGVTRRQLLEEIDRPALKSLPSEPYLLAEWRVRRVGIDYHVEIGAHYYSVPFRLARAEVEVRFTVRTVEIFRRGERVAVHQRMSGNHGHTTLADHMPSAHRRYRGWTVERIREEALAIGPATSALCDLILEARPHPEQGFRACLGIVRLARSYGVERLEAASNRAIDIGARSYGSLKSAPARAASILAGLGFPQPSNCAPRGPTGQRPHLPQGPPSGSPENLNCSVPPPRLRRLLGNRLALCGAKGQRPCRAAFHAAAAPKGDGGGVFAGIVWRGRDRFLCLANGKVHDQLAELIRVAGSLGLA